MLITAPIFHDPIQEEYTRRTEDPEFICKINNWSYNQLFLSIGRKFINPRAITIDEEHLPEPERKVVAKPWTHEYWTLATKQSTSLVLHRWTYLDNGCRYTLELEDTENDNLRYARLITTNEINESIRAAKIEMTRFNELKAVTTGCANGLVKVVEDRQVVNAKQTKLKGTTK